MTPLEVAEMVAYHLVPQDVIWRQDFQGLLRVQKYIMPIPADEKIVLASSKRNPHLFNMQVKLFEDSIEEISVSVLKKSFINACLYGNLENVKTLLGMCSDSHVRCKGFRKACDCGHYEIAKFLIDSLPPEDLHIGCCSAFEDACTYGRTKLVKDLLNVLTVEDICSNLNRGFLYACMFGRIEIVKILVEILPIWYIENNFEACVYQNFRYKLPPSRVNIEIRQILLQKLKPTLKARHNLDLGLLRELQRTFAYACINGWMNIVMLSLDAVHPEDLKVAKGFVYACKYGHVEIVKTLMKVLEDHKLVTRTLYNNGHHEALQKGHTEVVKILSQDFTKEELEIINS